MGQTEDAREQLVARLRAIIEWASERDHGRAVELDVVVHGLELLAEQRGAEGASAALAQKDQLLLDAARAADAATALLRQQRERRAELAQAADYFAEQAFATEFGGR